MSSLRQWPQEAVDAYFQIEEEIQDLRIRARDIAVQLDEREGSEEWRHSAEAAYAWTCSNIKRLKSERAALRYFHGDPVEAIIPQLVAALRAFVRMNRKKNPQPTQVQATIERGLRAIAAFESAVKPQKGADLQEVALREEGTQ